MAFPWVVEEQLKAADLNRFFGLFFGDGIDGAYTLANQGTAPAGITKTDNTNGATIFRLDRDVYVTNFTINATVTLLLNGYQIYTSGTFLSNGILERNGSNGGNGSAGAGNPGWEGGAGGAGGAPAPAGSLPASAAGGNGGNGALGVDPPPRRLCGRRGRLRRCWSGGRGKNWRHLYGK